MTFRFRLSVWSAGVLARWTAGVPPASFAWLGRRRRGRPRFNGSSAILVVLMAGCATASPRALTEPEPIRGVASWYGEEFSGRVTASGEIFDPLQLTAAHPSLPFGTIATVTNLANGQTVEVRINDRGPFVGRRIIDLSYGAAKRIGLVEAGIGPVEVNVVQLGSGSRARPQEPNVQTADDAPPPVPFPLPDDLGSEASMTTSEDDEFDVEVVEERGGVPTRRRVGATGRELESVPLENGTPIPVAAAAPPPPPATAVPVERFFLQLGAFQNQNNADTLRKKAAAIVPATYVEESLGLFRVRVGPFTSRVRALEIQERLRKAELPSLLLTE